MSSTAFESASSSRFSRGDAHAPGYESAESDRVSTTTIYRSDVPRPLKLGKRAQTTELQPGLRIASMRSAALLLFAALIVLGRVGSRVSPFPQRSVVAGLGRWSAS
jgi:hypothetical protein